MLTLEDGRRAIEQGDFQQARLIFESILEENPRNEEVWLELAKIVTETSEKRLCYETILAINRKNKAARQALRALEPEDDPIRRELFQEADNELTGDNIDLSTIQTLHQAERETPTAILVVTGLLISVVVFVLGSGLAFFVLTTLTCQ